MRLTRTDLGPLFCEGARLLWLALEQRGLNQTEAARLLVDAARKIRCDGGMLGRWLYGDRKPGRLLASRILEIFGVPIEAWDRRPKKAFAPPAMVRTRGAA